MYSSYFIKKCKFPMSNNDVDFIPWIDEVECIVMNESGFHLLDLPDENYMEYFTRHFSPQRVANIVVNGILNFSMEQY